MYRQEITKDLIDTKLRYDPKTGIFYCANARSCRNGHVVNGAKSHGYLMYRVGPHVMYGQRLAWFLTYGWWPDDDIDHINGMRADNRIENLRVVSHRMNSNNRRHSNSKSGLLGVQASKKRWRAILEIDGKSVHLGTFDTKEEAHRAYVEKKREIHPGFML